MPAEMTLREELILATTEVLRKARCKCHKTSEEAQWCEDYKLLIRLQSDEVIPPSGWIVDANGPDDGNARIVVLTREDSL